MLIRSFKINKSYLLFCIIVICILLILIVFYIFYPFSLPANSSDLVWKNTLEDTSSKKKSYIKWVDFNATYEVLDKTSKLDINSHNNVEAIQYNWIELLSYLACKYGGNFKKFNQKDLTALTEKLKSGSTMEDLSKDMKNYSYYYQAFDAVLHEFIGEYEVEVPNTGTEEKTYIKKYGVKAFLPIAKNYSFSHYDDFGNSRSYGYKRVHLGNDLMGSIGTPIVAVESGTVEALGWNQYGGWRIGIRSFDKKRYYYYAHLRKDHPYVKDLAEGQVVKAGDVIGYLGMTGYSTKENVNNINIPHLHFGMQLIFDECQKDGSNQIWIDVYQIIEFLRKNKSEVIKENNDTKDYVRKYDMKGVISIVGKYTDDFSKTDEANLNYGHLRWKAFTFQK